MAWIYYLLMCLSIHVFIFLSGGHRCKKLTCQIEKNHIFLLKINEIQVWKPIMETHSEMHARRFPCDNKLIWEYDFDPWWFGHLAMVLVFHLEVTHVNVTPSKLVKNHIILKKNYACSLKKGNNYTITKQFKFKCL